MPERKRLVSVEPDYEPRNNNLERFRQQLVIDKDDLDQCLMNQPELVWHVADAHSLAVAEFDAAKLDLEIAEAEEAQKIRDHAAKMEEKITEGGVKEELTLIKRIQTLRRDNIERKRIVAEWAGLKEAFDNRKYMLREIVPMYLSKFGTGTITPRPRDALAENVRQRAGEARARRGYQSGDK